MAKRKRKPRTFDSSGADLGAFSWSDPSSWLDTPATAPIVLNTWATSDYPDMQKMVVYNGTPVPDDGGITNVFPDNPQAGYTTWYRVSPFAQVSANIQAAIETVQATGGQIASAGGAVLDAAAGLAKNIVPILIGIAALFFLFSTRQR